MLHRLDVIWKVNEVDFSHFANLFISVKSKTL
jgi:hypothetical protein